MSRTEPYNEDEQRVCDYLQKLAPDIGCGDDPIGFLLASHAMLIMERNLEKALDPNMFELNTKEVKNG